MQWAMLLQRIWRGIEPKPVHAHPAPTPPEDYSIMADAGIFAFKIMYKMRNSSRVEHEDMISAHLQEVLTYLKSKGVSKDTVSQLFIHQITKDGIAELVTVDNSNDGGKYPVPISNVTAGKDKPPFDTPSNVSNIAEARARAASKPHIKLKASDLDPVPEVVVVKQGLYTAARI